MTSKIRMKKKPVKPNLMSDVKYYLMQGDTLKKIYALNPDGKFNNNYGTYFYIYQVPDSEAVAKKKMDTYAKEIKEYNQWYEENKEQIDSQLLEAARIKKERAVIKKEMEEIANRTKELKVKLNELK